MRRNRVFGDLLSQLFERTGQFRGQDDRRSLPELCEALLSAEGEVSGYSLAATLLARYAQANDADRLAFFQSLNADFDIDAEQVAALARAYADTPSTETFRALSQAAEPRRQELLRRLNQPVGATHALVGMRTDLLRLLPVHPDLKRTDIDFMHLLRSWFNRGFLVLREIDWDTPARILDKIVDYEAVHQIDDLDDLRRRLNPADRRCFAFFHPSMPDEPLIFVEVALTSEIPGSIAALLEEERDPLDPADARAAVFYSISNCQKGLAGISFGNLLIKQVVTELSATLPSLQTFVTLSPIPGLNAWLSTKTDDAEIGAAVRSVLSAENPRDIPAEPLKALAARYLLTAKTDAGAPLDPVARFHLGNGAEIHDLHAAGDPSPNGLALSSGAMVNYLYDLRRTERNHEDFATNGTIAASRTVQTLSSTAPGPKSKESVA
ncbi:malonyl-CoA decarboxylase domain-containing protein [Cognatishimia sp. F0-27]|uniref:malonyl-CoA decarboxylase domain-containing protein n=1 Tax=Cognatishimia sp. F0-27 TaxID=2816855 RepID=UPI001D0CBA0C|nr:malonyl-CoA decarboxylase family protein [Cognatishimia sp. F0-27]MCC1494320.1 malonyl-CoA decarboxylase family protein [Cognatishimia sp. F0-27]